MGNKWMKELQAMEGAVDRQYNPFAPENVMQSPSPYLNWIFGKGSGIPYGYSAVLFGEPKAGKSLVSNLFVGAMHKQNPDYMAIKFNTEMREEGQMAPYWGINQDSYQAYNVNEPKYIFDRIMDEFVPLIQKGMPLKLLIIDSLQGMQGLREANAESIENQQIGDQALTIQKGLKMILPVIRKHHIALICTAHIRANLDGGMYGPKTKMAGAWAQKHFFEYFVEVKRDGAADGKADELGEKFLDEDVKDARGNAEKTAHKIYVQMADSSLGRGTGRAGRFTLSYDNGLINTHEEIFLLAKNLGLVEMPNNRTYVVGDQKFNSKEEFLTALRDNQELAQKIVKAVYARDIA